MITIKGNFLPTKDKTHEIKLLSQNALKFTYAVTISNSFPWKDPRPSIKGGAEGKEIGASEGRGREDPKEIGHLCNFFP